MEAATPKRALLRITVALGGVLLTLGLAIATAVLLVRQLGAKPTQLAAPAAAPEAFDSVESYRLPFEPAAPLEVTPVSLAPVEPPAYEAPSYDPLSLATPPATDAFPSTPMPPYTGLASEPGSVIIHNPAAFGPPEDDTIPGLPTTAPTPSVSLVPSQGPVFSVAPEPQPGGWEGPEGVVTEEVAAAEEPEASIAAVEPPKTGLIRRPEPTARTLREIAEPNRDALLSYTASTKDLSRRLEPEVQAAFDLGKSGAVFAAREKFVAVLRKIALAKDAAEGTTRRAEALADGLRTLEEADDFVPRGDALEAELDVAAIARSHGVRLDDAAGPIAPHEAIAQYSQHAAGKLAEAVAGEPAGSMALYGLGKSYARLEAQAGDTNAGRKCLVMYRAAIDAHAQNYLAANELGVRLAQAGRHEQASQVLRQAAAQPGAIATVHANLAAIEDRLGRERAAVLAKTQSERLAQRERMAGEASRRHGVEWVDPAAFRRAPTAAPAMPVATPQAQQIAPGYAAVPAPAESGGWRGFVDRAKRATGWSTPPANQPTAPAAVASQPRVYR